MRRYHSGAFALLIYLIGVLAMASENEMANVPKCTQFPADFEDKFYEILLDYRNMTDEDNPVKNALAYLEEIKTACTPMSTEQSAYVLHMAGEVNRMAYKLFKEQRFFDVAMDAYNKALELKAGREEKIYWHMAMLTQSAGRYEEGIKYINIVLNMDPTPKNPAPYLETAFLLVVEAGRWEDAKNIAPVLQKYRPSFYRDMDLLDASVRMLCHFKLYGDAHQIIKNVENTPKIAALNEKEKEKVAKIKSFLKAQEKGSGI